MFADRQEAGRRLAQRLAHLKERRPVVLALPRGGVVVGAEIAAALQAPLDVLVVRKLGAPGQPELAIGAVTDGEEPTEIFNEQVISALQVDRAYLEHEIAGQLEEVRRRQRLYRGGRPAVALAGRTAIVVDDGVATGATVRAGLEALRRGPVGRTVLAVPVAPAETAQVLEEEVDELVCLQAPSMFPAVGSFYRDFRQVSDAEVVALLEEAAARPVRAGEGPPPR